MDWNPIWLLVFAVNWTIREDVFTDHEYLLCLCEMGRADAMLLKIGEKGRMIQH